MTNSHSTRFYTNTFHKLHLSDLLHLKMPEDAKLLYFKGFKEIANMFKEDKSSKD